MSIRKYNVELNDNNPFIPKNGDFNESPTWDWHYERVAHTIKTDTIKYYDDLLNLIVENRGLMQDIFFIMTVDFPTLGLKFDDVFFHYMQSLFNRMIKTSKVIQDLSVQGSYIEANALLRSNYERAVLIQYFSKNNSELYEFLDAKKNENKKILKKYSMKNLIEIIHKKYQEYKYLCHFAHPNMYWEDLSLLRYDKNFSLSWFQLKPYNFFDKDEFFTISYWNNNLLVETFVTIYEYLTKDLSKIKMTKNLKYRLDQRKKIGTINLVEETPKSHNQ